MVEKSNIMKTLMNLEIKSLFRSQSKSLTLSPVPKLPFFQSKFCKLIMASRPQSPFLPPPRRIIQTTNGKSLSNVLNKSSSAEKADTFI